MELCVLVQDTKLSQYLFPPCRSRVSGELSVKLNEMLRGNFAMTSISYSGGSHDTPSRLMLRGNRNKLRLGGPLGSNNDCTLSFFPSIVKPSKNGKSKRKLK